MEQKILSLKDDKINSEVELIEYPEELIGGRNLLNGSDFTKTPNDAYSWVYSSSAIQYYFNGSQAVYKALINSSALRLQRAIMLKKGVHVISISAKAKYGFDFYNFVNAKILSKYSQSVDEMTTHWAVFEVLTDGEVVIRPYLGSRYQIGDEIFVENIKLEKGNKATDWTPAPEDLNLSYPDFITEFKPSISDRYILTEELIEYPAELIGGRNLLVKNAMSKGYYNASGVLVGSSNVFLSSYIEVHDGKSYTAKSFNSTDNNGGRVVFFDVNKTYVSRGELNIEEVFIIPTGVSYIRYQSDKVGGVYVDDAVIVAGNKALTDWTPAPEDLNLSYPDHIQSFGTSFSNNILINEFIEQ